MAAEKTTKVIETSLEQGCAMLKTKFKNEREFVENLILKLEHIIKEAYGLDVETIQPEKPFHLKQSGYFNIKVDLYVTTKQGKDIIIECKNPIHDKSETFNAIGQMMSYDYLVSKMHIKPIIILATSNWEFFYFDVIKKFNLKFDLIINNKDQAAFWVNDL